MDEGLTPELDMLTRLCFCLQLMFASASFCASPYTGTHMRTAVESRVHAQQLWMNISGTLFHLSNLTFLMYKMEVITPTDTIKEMTYGVSGHCLEHSKNSVNISIIISLTVSTRKVWSATALFSLLFGGASMALWGSN